MANFKKNTVVVAGAAVLWIAIQMMRSAPVETRPPAPQESAAIQTKTTPSLPQLTPWVVDPSANLDEGISLARQRGEMMRELIRSNPERAVKEALTLSEWVALPDELREYVEEPFSTVADIEVLVACGDGSSKAAVMTEFPGHREMETFIYGRRTGVGSKNGAPVQGIRLGGLGALREEIFQSLDGADRDAALILFPVAVPDPGGDSVAALAGGRVFYFKSQADLDEANRRLADLENLPGPDAGAQALFQSLEELAADGGGIDFGLLEQLAYAASEAWTGTPRDMYVILVDFPDLSGQPTDPVALSNSINTTVSQQIWDMSYKKTHIVCSVNPKTYRMADASTDYADTEGSYPNAHRMYSNATALVEADGIDLSPYETISVFFAHIEEVAYGGLATVGGEKMWINGTTSTKTFVHELGHNYGAKHANFWQVSGGNPVAPTGSEIGYGDFTDIMGSGTVPSGHFNAWHKRHLNWFDAGNWLPVSSSGTHRVYRSDHRETTGLLRGLEIQKGGGDQYWVGLRQEQTGYETFSRGAYVLWKMEGDNESDLLDMSPLSNDGKHDGGLALGQTYSDAAAAVHITPTARGGQTPNEWMDITVNLGAFPGNTAPIASLSGSSSLGVGESSVFTVAASDADGDELAYFWDIGDGLVKGNSPSLSATWLVGGTVDVSCVVSDMKGGTNRVSKTVSISSPLDNWTQRTSGTSNPLNDIAYGGGRLVAVGTRVTAYSDDGASWATHNDGTPWMGNAFLHGIIHDGAQFLACGMNYHSGWVRSVFTSPNGTHWTERYFSPTSTGNTYFYDMAYGNGIYVAVGSDGQIVRSTDGTNWSSVSSGTTTNLQGVGYGDGIFVAVGADGSANNFVSIASSNGLAWADNTAGVDLDSWKGLFDVQYCNDRFLAGGFYARILGSTDSGQSFTTSMAGDRQRISSFAFGNGTYFAAGINNDDGNADINLTSLDGATWTELATASQDDRNAAVFYNGTFITVGDNGSIWQSGAIGSSGSGFAVWQLENAEALGLDRDPFDDADFDGSLNLVEYALGSVATDAGSLPSSAMDVSGIHFQVSYGRNGIMGDIDYQVERSANLLSNDWSTASTVVVTNTAEVLTVRSAIPMAVQTNEFLRLKVGLK